MTSPVPHERTDRLLVFIVGLIVPLAIVLACAALMVSWIPSLPHPIAIHWGSEGVDGFGSVWTFILLPVGITTFFCIVAFAGVRFAAPDGRVTVNRHLAG
jgi:uncharacterized membrane protein